MKVKILKILGFIILFVFLYELAQAMYRQYCRVSIFHSAKRRARLINKRLIVVGDPYYGHGSRFYSKFMPNYECGDETVDLTGSPNCSNGVKSDLYDYLRNQPSNSGVIFISCVLEYVPNIKDTIYEIERVAGDTKNIYVVTVNQWTLSAYFYKDPNSTPRQIVYAPPEYSSITYRSL
jgi:hypothetical protein